MEKLTEAILTPELLDDLKERIKDSGVSFLKQSIYNTKRDKYTVSDVFRNEENRIIVYLINDGLGSNEKIDIVKLLTNPNYDLTGEFKALRDYFKQNKDTEPNIYKIIRNWLLYVPIDASVKPAESEVEWLKKHVTKIKARLPKRYKRAFESNFPGEPYSLVGDKSWAISFHMSFDEVDDMPDSLKHLTNKEGNSVNLERKTMNNTSYIWNLVKEHPEDFHFSAAEQSEPKEKKPAKPKEEQYVVLYADDGRINANIYHYSEDQIRDFYQEGKLTTAFKGSMEACDKYIQEVEQEEEDEYGGEVVSSGDLANYIVYNLEDLK